MDEFMLWLFRVLWAVGAILLFGLAILIHEYGHFLAAKLLGFKIDAFSIGFGPALWKKKVNGVDYRIGCIPLGGYVALPQLDPSAMDAIQGENSDRKEADGREVAQPAWKRMVVAIAGPLGNIVLAVVVAFIIYAASTPDNFGGIGVTVGYVKPGSATAQAGLAVGDKFLSVNGNPVSCWNEIAVECILGANTNTGIRASVEREGQALDLVLPVKVQPKTGYAFIPDVDPRLRCLVGKVNPGSPAEAAGLKKGDLLVAANGVDLNGPDDLIRRVTKSEGKPIELKVERYPSGNTEVISLLPQYNEEAKRPLIGIIFGQSEAANQPWMMYRRPSLQLSNDAKGIFRILRALFAPRVKGEASRAAKGMGGAVTLFVIFWMQLQSGLIHTLAFLRYLCINLAIINLLPIPVLDGGHVLFALIEMITRRKPSPKLVGWIYNIFVALLIGLMVILVFRDVWRFKDMVRQAQDEAEVEQTEAAHE